jgi:tetratricopeptide (TPR) repeat protein
MMRPDPELRSSNPTEDKTHFGSSPVTPSTEGTGTRRLVLLGLLGLFLLLSAVPAYDAWVVNRAGVIVNRVLVEKAAEVQERPVAGVAATTTTTLPSATSAGGDALARARDLLERATARGPRTAARQIPMWRTLGAAAMLEPSDETLELLTAAGRAGLLDRIGQLWLGEVASALGYWDQATEAYRQVDASNILISRADADLQKGEKDRAAREYLLAHASLEAAIERDQAERLLRYVGGEESPKAGSLMTSTSQRVTALYRIGKGLLVAGRAADALPILEDALQKSTIASPGAVVQQSLNLNLGLALARTLPERPASFATRYASYYPDKRTMAYLQTVSRIRGLIYPSIESDRTAQVCLQAGRVLLLIGDDEQGVALLSQAIALDPTLTDAYLVLGDWYESKSMKLLPFDLYQKAAEQLPADVRISVARALAAYRALPPDQALPLLYEAAGTSTDDPYLFATLGDCCFQLGLIWQARQAYEEGLRRSPGAAPLLERVKALEGPEAEGALEVQP